MNLTLSQKFSSTVLGPVTYVFSSSSLDLPQLPQATSIFYFLKLLNFLNTVTVILYLLNRETLLL